jgi:hypothetical protein
VTPTSELPATQLIVLRFASGTRFEGGLIGALERMASGGAMRVLDVLFVQSDAETGALTVLPLPGGARDDFVATALDVRLDERKRRELSEEALRADGRLEEFRGALARGEALAAILVEHRWAGALGEAVGRMDGTLAAAEFVRESTLEELLPRLTASAGAAP